MWQKERLLQIGVERALDEDYRKLVFLDADIIFEHEDWPRRVNRALDKYSVLQCFSTAIRNYNDTMQTQSSAALNVIEAGKELGGAKGIAWAVSAQILEKIGLYQHCIVGGGDTAFCSAALGLVSGREGYEDILSKMWFLRFSGQAMRNHYLKWARKFYEATGGSCGFLDQKVFTLSHGSCNSRNYNLRHRILADFDPEAEVAVGVNGAFVWTELGRPRKPFVEDYFLRRKEDF